MGTSVETWASQTCQDPKKGLIRLHFIYIEKECLEH